VKKAVWALLLLAVAGAIVWGVLRKSDLPRVNFAKAKRERLVSTLPTNGKVEPVQWQAVRAEISGIVTRLTAESGQEIAAGAVIAAISDPTVQGDIEAAQAKLDEARANLTGLQAGGRPTDLAEIDNSLNRARFDLEQARSTLASLERLKAKQAATQQEVDAAHQKVQQSELEIAGLAKRRESLAATVPSLSAAKARVQDAEAALSQARSRGALLEVRTPIAGIAYGCEARRGSYVNAGDLICNIGRMDELRVRVFVDEPELGRVEVGELVTITWDALPGRHWEGRVERKPSAIQSLGSRQVGEVLVSIPNEGRVLVPGTNVNADIRTAVAENAIVVPKEALRHDPQGDFVYVLKGDAIERCAVKKGVSSITQTQITEGLNENDSVALPGDVAIKPGDRVTPVFRPR